MPDQTVPQPVPAPLSGLTAEILKQQLEMQKEILRNQQRSVELQEQLIAALTGENNGLPAFSEESQLRQAANPQSAWRSKLDGDEQPDELKLRQGTTPPSAWTSEQDRQMQATDLNLPGVPSAPAAPALPAVPAVLAVPTGKGAVEQQEAYQAKDDPAMAELQEFVDRYKLQPECIPWFMAPSFSSFFGIMKLSMKDHPGDLAVCFPDRSAFFEAAEAAMSPGRFRDFLVTSLELRLLFQSLLLSITVPASLGQNTPETGLDLVISVFTFLLGVLNTIGVCLCIFATGILSSVSENNFVPWLHANYRFVHAALSSQCAMVPMILFLQAACQIRTQLSIKWLGTLTLNVLCAVQIAMIMFIMTAMLIGTNAAGRTAAFSGAMGDAAVPARKSILSSTLGGNKVGLFGMKKYLTAVMWKEEEDNTESVKKKKTLLHKSNSNQGKKQVDIRKFDIAVF